MGQDLSVIFVPVSLPHERLLAIVKGALADAGVGNLVVAIGAGPTEFPLGGLCPEFTAFTVWADVDANLDSVAASLSESVPQGCIILTVVDHACVGGWQQFHLGRLIADNWLEGDRYLGIACQGLERIARGSLSLMPDDEHDLLVFSLAEPTTGYCLLSTSRRVKPGRLTKRVLESITEDDVPGVTYECLLGGAA